jgi:hypothetical protein
VISLSFTNSKAQNFTWLTGASGISTANATTVDSLGFVYTVGAYDPSPANTTAFEPGISSLATTTSGIVMYGYVAKHHSHDGRFLFASSIVVDPCSMPTQEAHVTVKKIVRTESNQIYIMGAYTGCNLVFNDTLGVPIFNTTSSTAVSNNPHQKIFVAHLDSNFTALGCHVFSSSVSDVYPGDIAYTPTPSGDGKIFVAMSDSSDMIIEGYGLASVASGFTTQAFGPNHSMDIYIAEIDTPNDTLVNAIVIGGPNNQLIGALASGYLGYQSPTSDLYMTGAFEGTLNYTDTNLTADTLLSQGDYDVFVCRFNNYDLNSQLYVTAGGPWRDQGLSLSDNGKFVGGYISDTATFGTAVTFTNLGIRTYDAPVVAGNKKQVAFYAIPDFTNLDWIYADTLINARDAQVDAIATSVDCDEIYIGASEGVHPAGGMESPANTLSLPYVHFKSDHIYISSMNGGNHCFLSEIRKYQDMGNSTSLKWRHNFAITMPQGPSNNEITARFVTDIQCHNFPRIGQAGDRDSSDVIYVGRFGRIDSAGFAQDMKIPYSVTNSSTSFNGNFGGANTHFMSGAFIGALDERPQVEIVVDTMCLTDDPFNIPITILPGNGATFNITSGFTFSGAGIMDTNTGLFDPTVAGYGPHTITLSFDYMGCEYTDIVVAELVVVHGDFPFHPTTNTLGWSRGLGVEAWHYENDNALGYDIYYACGTYENAISFLMDDGTTHTLTSNLSTPSGFIVGYGACGAVWVDHFQADFGGDGCYIEALKLDKASNTLYAVGGVDDGLTISYENTSLPAPPPNTTNGHSIAFNADEKGIVMAINATNGRVNQVYYGSDLTSENNRFHGLDLAANRLAVVGEFEGVFTGSNSGVYATAAGGATDEDIIVLMLNATTFADIDARSFGALENDHGDAISLYEDTVSATNEQHHLLLIGDVSGSSNPFNFIQNNFTTTIPTALNSYAIPLANGTDIVLAHYIFSNSGVLSEEELRHFDGDDDDHGLDIKILGAGDFAGMYPYEVVFCGQITSEIDTSNMGNGTMLPTLGGAGTTDGFVASTNSYITQNNWFSREGTIFGNFESFDALEYHNGNVFGVGKTQDNPTTGLLGNGGHSIPIPRVGLFTVQFEPDGTYDTSSITIPGNSGTSECVDVRAIDTSLIVTGYLDITSGSDMTFHNGSGGVITPTAGVDEVYIARFGATYNSFFKTGERNRVSTSLAWSELRLFPNPNSGRFIIESNDEFNAQVKIFSSDGQQVYFNELFGSNSYSLDLRLSSGIYQIILMNDDQLTQRSFVVL